MLFRGLNIKLVVSIIGLFYLAGCNDPDERKTHYITVYVSQDVEIKEVLIDLDMKKPGVVVEHPEGVEAKHRPTKPRSTVSFDPLPPGIIGLLLVILTLVLHSGSLSCQPFGKRLLRGFLSLLDPVSPVST